MLPSLLIARILESSVYPSSTIASIQSQKYSMKFSKFSKTFQSSDISNPDSHLWKILRETHIDGSVQTEIIFLFEPIDGFNIFFIEIYTRLSLWFFNCSHSYFLLLIDKIFLFFRGIIFHSSTTV